MKDQLKTVFNQTAIYSLGNISTKLVGFVLLPLYTGYLTTSEYGILALLEVVNQILIAIFTFNLPTAMLRWCAEQRSEKEEKEIIFTVLFTLIFIAGFVFVIGADHSKDISIILFGKVDYTEYINVMLFASAMNIINRHPLNLLRHRQKAGFYATINVVKLTLILLMNIYFVAYAEIGVLGVVLSMAIGELFLFIFTLKFIVQNIVVKIKYKLLIDMLKYGFPLVFAALSSIALTFSDRFILQHFFGESEVGVYSLGYKIAAVINMFLIQSFSLGYLPFTFKKLNEPGANKLFSKVMTYYSLALVFSALFLTFFSKELIMILARQKDYLQAYLAVPLISFAFVFRGMQYNASLSFHFSKRTSINALIIVLAAILNICLNIVFVPMWGFLGSGVSMCLSFLLMFIITIKPAQKNYFIPYEMGKLIKLFAFSILAIFLFYYLESLKIELLLGVALKIMIIILLITLIFIFNVIDKKEKAFIFSKLHF